MADRQESNFSQDQKRHILKTFTNLIKESRGRGPGNIVIKYFSDQMYIVVQGLLTPYENYLIQHHGEKARSTLEALFVMDCPVVEKRFSEAVDLNCGFEIYEAVADCDSDVFIYKMKIK